MVRNFSPDGASPGGGMSGAFRRIAPTSPKRKRDAVMWKDKVAEVMAAPTQVKVLSTGLMIVGTLAIIALVLAVLAVRRAN